MTSEGEVLPKGTPSGVPFSYPHFAGHGYPVPIPFCAPAPQGRVHKNVVILKLDGVNSLEDAQGLRGKMLYLDRKDLVLEPGQYFIQDLLGSTVADAEDPEKVYGVLVDVTNTGASDIYHIKAPDGRLLLAPAIPQVVKQVDPEQEKILITPLEGLFD